MRMTIKSHEHRFAAWVSAWAMAAIAFSAGCGSIAIEPIEPGDAGTESTAGESSASSLNPWIGSGGGGPCGLPEAPRTGADRQVRDMSVPEARAWCETYVTKRYPHDHYEPERPEYLGDHYPEYIHSYAGMYCWELVPGGGCLVQPTIDDCVANLLHAPCEGTIAALDDCVDSFFHPTLQCAAVGGGCTPFTSAPHCEETVIMSWALQPPPDAPGTSPFPGMDCQLRLSSTCD